MENDNYFDEEDPEVESFKALLKDIHNSVKYIYI